MVIRAKILGLGVVLLAVVGCARLGYYAHLGGGAWRLVTGGHGVDKLIASPGTSMKLKNRLLLARDLLGFAGDELGLPIAGKYRKYLDVERPYVVWTVVAAPEFSLTPRTWCFPVAGCVAYRGFFSKEKADRFARKLRLEGMDVSVGGVRAFSSLGWLGDPLLSTFLFSQDRDLAALLFHELAHGVVYVKDDSSFNESFATAVERFGVRLWLERMAPEDAQTAIGAYDRELAQEDRAYEVIRRSRGRLEQLYDSSEPNMRVRKAELFTELGAALRGLSDEGNFALSGWVGRDLNNADLAGLGLYRERLGSLEALLKGVENDLARFFASAKCLAALDLEERSERLEARSWSDCILAGSEIDG